MKNDPIMKKILEEDPDIRAAEDRYQEFLSNPKLVAVYHAREDFRRECERIYQDARDKGIDIRREDCLREMNREIAVEYARCLKDLGSDVASIREVTGLTEKEVAEL